MALSGPPPHHLSPGSRRASNLAHAHPLPGIETIPRPRGQARPRSRRRRVAPGRARFQARRTAGAFRAGTAKHAKVVLSGLLGCTPFRATNHATAAARCRALVRCRQPSRVATTSALRVMCPRASVPCPKSLHRLRRPDDVWRRSRTAWICPISRRFSALPAAAWITGSGKGNRTRDTRYLWRVCSAVDYAAQLAERFVAPLGGRLSLCGLR
jgi:hypothetical protein